MISLSFDIEEFDTPLEYGINIPFEEQMCISIEGTNNILDILEKYEIKATFFCTANFAINSPETINRMISNGHEIASHGYYHSSFSVEDLAKSRQELMKRFNVEIKGYRMARMMPVDEKEIYKAGYLYNSSLHPTWIPGRYNNIRKPRTPHIKDGVMQIPASVSPIFRLPLFWLSFHHFPKFLYNFLAKSTLKKDKQLVIYFHPWEFVNLKPLKLPYIITHKSGDRMCIELEKFISHHLKHKKMFGTMSDLYRLNS